MPRPALWSGIAATLLVEITGGHYPPGARLPTESALSNRFGVNRHTVRAALADLAARGLVHARRGAGVFVTAPATDYPLGRRVRFHRNVEGSGRTPSRRLTRLETRAADAAEAAALALAPGAMVHVCEGVSLADGVPVATFRSVFPAERLPGMLRHLAEVASVTRALAAEGVADYTRASTRLTARIARGPRAQLLQVPEGAPVLRSEAVNVDTTGVPVEYGRTWFAGDRVTLVVAGEDAPD